MACLSIVREHGPVTVAANPIFLLDAVTSTPGSEVAFEVFDDAAGHLKILVGQHRCFYIDDEVGVFWARLESLNPCGSTHPGLALLKHKPTLRGLFVIVGDSGNSPVTERASDQRQQPNRPCPSFSAPYRRRVSAAGRRAARGRMVCQFDEPSHAPRLPKGDHRFHAVHRYRPAGGVSDGDARACHRLA